MQYCVPIDKITDEQMKRIRAKYPITEYNGENGTEILRDNDIRSKLTMNQILEMEGLPLRTLSEDPLANSLFFKEEDYIEFFPEAQMTEPEAVQT